MAANLNKISDRVKDISKGSKPNQRRGDLQNITGLKSKGLLAHRTTGRPPFLAWVEDERAKVGQYPMDAEYSAADEERRLEYVQSEKERKLRKFQQDVRQRVRALDRLKKMQQLDKSYEAVAAEQNIIYQSSFPRRVPTTKKDTCVYREANYSSLQAGIPGSCKYDYSVVNDPEQVNIASELLDKHVEKVQTSTQHARKVLGSQVANFDVEQLTELPGGVWNAISSTRQKGSEVQNPKQGGDQNSNLPNTTWDRFAKLTNEVKNVSVKERAAMATNTHASSRLTGALTCEDYDGEICQGKTAKTVNFLGICENDDENRVVVDIVKNKAYEDLLRPGKVEEQSKKQVQKQLAVYRRLFMDIEREQVRENLRMKEHRKRMIRLKHKQEIKRKEVECELDEIIEERNLVAHQKAVLEERLRQDNLHNDMIKESKKIQKEKELDRYVQALRATLKEKIVKKKLQVPPLCSCGTTIFDTDPETCANNCIFYKNPKGYVKAMSSILSTAKFDL